MKQSEILVAELEKADKALSDACDEKYRNKKDLSEEDRKVISRKIDDLFHKRMQLERDIRTARNRELDVGDGCTYHLYSDAYACTVIKKTKNTISVRRDKATLDPNFKPEFIPGGFAAHCINSSEQKYTYERDENGEVFKLWWSEKYGQWRKGSGAGAFVLTPGRHEFYDYNF